ncbi:hypothetical protein [Acidihalobacter aeolianus]|uniref:hypothetical protein n=1 Tax=Acidihalobacter aeolianus TaxID=2792603 RepID=UPI0012EA1383|nr:hypothetical protein [Acidihalobacter aeolianus]
MSILSDIKIKLEKYRFDRVISKIYMTRPLKMSDDGPVLLSQLCHRDVAPYLLAAKSLYFEIGKGRFKIVNDGSLTEDDISILQHHIPILEIININTIDTTGLPSGGTWERLIRIIELTHDNYVIQFDADVLAIGSLDHVTNFINLNKSFILGTYSGQQVNHASYTASLAQGWIASTKTQKISSGLLAEASLDSIPQTMPNNYVHGSSGFAGFGKKQFSIKLLKDFSDCMYKILGDRWFEWGSEQIASNYMLSNADNSEVLPIDLYACHEPHLRPSQRSLLHFIGSHRHSDATYRLAARDFIKKFYKDSN